MSERQGWINLMVIEKENKRLKDEEKQIEYPSVLKKKGKRRSVNINLWPLIPILVIMMTVNYFSGNGEGQSIWNYWWLIFLVKPILFGFTHKKKKVKKNYGIRNNFFT